MTLRQRIELQSGSVYAFVRQFGFSVPALYGVLRRKRSISKAMLAKLETVLGGDVPGMFDEDGVLLRK